jgi:hypothetical protein
VKQLVQTANLAYIGLSLLFAPAMARADASNRGFSVDFSQCTEAVGVGPVSLAKASALVPAPFTALPIVATPATTAAIVVRATSCAGVQVNGGAAVPTNISQIGVEIVAPDGTGDINNYTLIYLSNNPELVTAYNHAGVPALLDPTLTYQFTYDTTGTAGEVYVKAEGPGVPAYFISGTETDPTTPGFDFKANWWFAGDKGSVKQAADFPNIAFGTAAITLHTDRTSMIGQLIGGNTDSAFQYLPIRGKYPSAHMDVVVAGK